MAGRSNKGKNKRGAHVNSGSSGVAVSSVVPSNGAAKSSELSDAEANGNVSPIEAFSTESDVKEYEDAKSNVKECEDANSDGKQCEDAKSDVKECDDAQSDNQTKQDAGEIQLYPISVKTQGGGKLDLQLSPGDSVMDVRQFLLDASETCFFTCYDLLVHSKDGSVRELGDYSEISEVVDITAGDCSLEMVAALYDDRSMRAHVQRTRDLLSLSKLRSSLSTALALQYEMENSTPASSGDPMKTELPELENLGFMDDIAGSLTNLSLSPSSEIKCLESIVFSSFNPPPSYRRLVGDLIYLDVITLEGNKFCITGTTKMFFVNSSTKNTLDPRPSKSAFEAETLIGLLQKISPKFKEAFNEVLERKASAHPFENVHSLLPPTSWLGLYPIPDHKRDAARAEGASTLSFGSEVNGMQRDWNEELQSCREFPHSTFQERVMRDRALYRVTSDFVDAAVSGAIGVISRCIPPINPTDPECFHMYVHNNIFFSFAVDADLEQLSGKRVSVVNSSIGSGSPLSGPSEKSTNKFSTSGENSNGPSSESQDCGFDSSIGSGSPLSGPSEKSTNKFSTSGEKSNGPSSESQDCGFDAPSDVSAASESPLAESEQATYASSNNDLKGTKAYQEADVPGLYNLSMAIIDYRGHRVVAQSVLPGILQGDKSESLLYGSVDNGKKICWNEDFHSKVLEAAKRLHVKEHTVLDGCGKLFKLAAPVECKGIVGSDDRQYLLDLMRVTPRDANYTGPGSKFCILRPELVSSYCQAEAAKKSKNDSEIKGPISGVGDSLKVDTEKELGVTRDVAPDLSPSQDESKGGNLEAAQECNGATEAAKEAALCEQLLFNPNVLTEFKLAGTTEEIAADKENVAKVSTYLRDIVLPKFIEDLCTLEVSPMDGQTLTETLHSHGINVRYIGKVAEGTKHLPHLWNLCLTEILVRSAKHILKDLLRVSEDHDVGHAISHFFNCFFGKSQVSSEGSPSSMPTKSPKKDKTTTQTDKLPKVQEKWKKGASARSKRSSCSNITSSSLWSDIAEFAKAKYQFILPEDARSRVKKVFVVRNLCLKVGVTIAARKYDFDVATPFQTSDILNLQPVVKHSIPLCSEAKDLLETGKVQLAEGMLSEAYTLFSEAFTILQQVTGPMHREVANCCRYLAMVLYHAGDMTGAIMQQHKELIINERCLGLDHPDTAHSYGNMALFYHGLSQTNLALRHMSRALHLLGLSSGSDHPDVAATFINVAMMYQDIGKMNTALRYLQEALKKNERLLGEEHIQTAICYHAMALAFNSMGTFKLSYQHEKKTHEILVKQLGEEDSRTRDSLNWMNTFKMRDLQLQEQKQKGQALDAASAQKAIDLLKARPDLIKAFQAAALSGGSGNMNTSINLGRVGRGVDERATKAAAEVRKKAAAKGLVIRPQGQGVPPMTQLLNLVNSGLAVDSTGSNNSENKKIAEEGNGHVSSEGGGKGNNPVGLGVGLGPIDAKKQKHKANVAA